MKNFLSAFLVFVLWSVLALWFHQTQSNTLCGDCAITHEKLVKPQSIKKIEALKNEVINSNTSTQEIHFSIQSNKEEISGLEQQNVLFDSIYDFLNKHQNKQVIINSKYLANEVNAEGTNYGVLRGNFLKQKLSNFGINSDRITVKDSLSNYKYSQKENSYNQGISIIFKNLDENRVNLIEQNIANKTLHSYFAQKGFKPDRNLQTYAIELKNYLTKYPNKTVKVIGHTDIVGSAEANLWYGEQRAKNVVKYFVSQGIDNSKFTIESKGANEPIASNNIKEGRAKNRRIEIKIQ